MTSVPRQNPKRNDTRTYSLWEWTRAYLVLIVTFPLYAGLWLLASFVRTLPIAITRKLLQAHVLYTETHRMDFRIPPDEAIPAYMNRWWRIPRNWALNCYFHIVKRSDDDRALHCHPWWNFSIVLDGGYFEHEILEGGVHRKTWRGPGAMKFRWSGKKAHRLELAVDGAGEKPARTIFVTGPVLRRWGFHHKSGWIDAYDWDAFCEANGVKGMRMNGGSDAVVSSRNKIN